MVSFKGILSRK